VPATSVNATRSFAVTSERVERLDRLGAAGRMEHYERGEHSLVDLSVWAARYPDEPPLVNGEYAWIGLSLCDLD